MTDMNNIIRSKVIKQYGLNESKVSDTFIDDLVSSVSTITQFKVKTCKFCINKACLLLRKRCLFFNDITGNNPNFYKCKYFKRTYSNTEDDRIIKAYTNLISNIWLLGFNKNDAVLNITEEAIEFKYESLKMSFDRSSTSYNNVLADIKDALIEKYGIYDKENNFRVLQVSRNQIKYELKGEIFIYTITDYDLLKGYLSGSYTTDEIVDYITKNLRFEKSTKLMDISKEMKMLYDTAHCTNLVQETFESIHEFIISVSNKKDYKNVTFVSDGTEDLSVNGLPIGGTLVQLYYLVSLLTRYGFIFKLENLLVDLERDEYQIKFFKDKMPEISDLSVGL